MRIVKGLVTRRSDWLEKYRRGRRDKKETKKKKRCAEEMKITKNINQMVKRVQKKKKKEVGLQQMHRCRFM